MFNPIKSKIKTLKTLHSVLSTSYRKNKKIVAISGSMDMLHVGHVTALHEAKKKGDILIVFVNSDKSVQMYKGPNRPIVPEKERAYMVAALECVDYVVLFDEINPIGIVGVIRPDVYCNSSEWGKDCIERNIVESYGGKIAVIKRPVHGQSTTDILKRTAPLALLSDVRAVFLDRDGTINDDKDGYVHTEENFTFLKGVIPALKKIQKAGYLLFVVTNQSGIGRGYYTGKDVQLLHSWMQKKLKKEGITITKIYYCPHTPRDGCSCRKPGYDLFLQAVKEYKINLSKSWMIGDSWSDIYAGRSVNLNTIKIGPTKKDRKSKVSSHYAAKNLLDASRIICLH